MKNQLTNRLSLTKAEKDQCYEDITYRLNCMLSWDLFIYIRDKFQNQRSVFYQGEVLDPAFEISIVFGRQLLQFLKITAKENALDEFVVRKNDDITIDHLGLTYSRSPLETVRTRFQEKPLLDLLKVANKSVAHLTKSPATTEEQGNLKTARMIIYELILEYVPEIDTAKIRWTQKDAFRDAILQ